MTTCVICAKYTDNTCNICNFVNYCNEECQKLDKTHHLVCDKQLCEYNRKIIMYNKTFKQYHQIYGEKYIHLSYGLYRFDAICSICGISVTYAYRPEKYQLFFKHEKYFVNYYRCDGCFRNNYKLCHNTYKNSIECSLDENMKITNKLNIIMAAFVGIIPIEIVILFISKLINLRCCV